MTSTAVLPVVGLTTFITAAALLVLSIQPTASSTLDHHWQLFAVYAACSALLMLAALMLVGRRHRIAVAIISALAITLRTILQTRRAMVPMQVVHIAGVLLLA